MKIPTLMALAIFAFCTRASADVQFINNTPFKVKVQLWWEAGISRDTIIKEVDPKRWVLLDGDVWNKKKRIVVTSIDPEGPTPLDMPVTEGGNRIYELKVEGSKQVGQIVGGKIVNKYVGGTFTLDNKATFILSSFGYTQEKLKEMGINPVRQD